MRWGKGEGRFLKGHFAFKVLAYLLPRLYIFCMEKNITDVQCPACASPAYFDIKKGFYGCQYCGGKVTVKAAIAQKQGFKKLHQQKMKDKIKNYALLKSQCSGCGAEVVFNEGDALAKCAFCGKALVRQNYMQADNMPELIIPFKITREEAKERLLDWCRKNSLRREARIIRKTLLSMAERRRDQKEKESNTNLDENGFAGMNALPDTDNFVQVNSVVQDPNNFVQDPNVSDSVFNGFYLPYELLKGPVYCTVTRLEAGNDYYCDGYVDQVFVNRSSQLNNLLLDGMEPYNLSELTEFDFAYVAGHQVKIADVNDRELNRRICAEVEKDYSPQVRKVLETKAVSVNSFTGSLMRLPVLLPAYYFSDGNVIASVNGQTGKVSVQSIRNTHYIFLPWWLKALFYTALTLFIAFAVEKLLRVGPDIIPATMLGLGFITPIVMLVIFSETERHSFSLASGKKIFTSRGGAFVRKEGKLIQEKKPLKKKVTPPVFKEDIDGEDRFVVLRFTTFRRLLTWALRTGAFIFLPVIFALVINGFDFKKLNLGGSAVWFCLSVPLAPVFVVKFAILDLYDNPLIYLIKENGRLKRYRRKKKLPPLKDILSEVKELFSERWFRVVLFVGIFIFGSMVYLTAFGWVE